mmetsp:Transcript_27644/g.81258  ORF Transcript_27644/g.81258 Transcript_27644/m.81258 type:complete len:92 (-) Transcript_27644:525-800(-)
MYTRSLRIVSFLGFFLVEPPSQNGGRWNQHCISYLRRSKTSFRLFHTTKEHYISELHYDPIAGSNARFLVNPGAISQHISSDKERSRGNVE